MCRRMRQNGGYSVKRIWKIVSGIAGALVLLAAAFLVLRFGFGIDIFDRSGWREEEGGWQYRLKDGTPVTGWYTVDGREYYFDPDANGMMHTGWLDRPEGRYLLGSDGVMVTGWREVDGSTYYFGGSGLMQTGWLHLPEGTYRMDEAGVKQTGWVRLPEGSYWLGEDGLMATGWVELSGEKHYFRDDGTMYTGWLEQPEGRYYLDGDGVMCTQWLEQPEGSYWLGSDGRMYTGRLDWPGESYYLDENGLVHTGWLELEGSRYFCGETGVMATGWTDLPEGRYYFDEDGTMHTGWLELEGKTWLLKEDGLPHTGWLEEDGVLRWFREDGVMAIGKVRIDGTTRWFDSRGCHVELVNPWYYVRRDYQVELVYVEGMRVAAQCSEELKAMLAACRAAGLTCNMTSAYRTHAYQTSLWVGQVERYVEKGYTREEAERVTSLSIAVPGTSEHQLGLAVDLTRTEATYAWLREHSWEYGFIMRYLPGKTGYTGIYYEPWHYRYVGRELAKELYDLGICLEEYMSMLTKQAGY